MIIKSISIIVEDNEGKEDDTSIRFVEGRWYVEGPVFPRYMRLMNLISEFIGNEVTHAKGSIK